MLRSMKTDLPYDVTLSKNDNFSRKLGEGLPTDALHPGCGREDRKVQGHQKNQRKKKLCSSTMHQVSRTRYTPKLCKYALWADVRTT